MTEQQRAELERVILEIMAARRPLPMLASSLCRRAREALDYQVTEADVDRALSALRANGLVGMVPESTGSHIWWHLTTRGLAAAEE